MNITAVHLPALICLKGIAMHAVSADPPQHSQQVSYALLRLRGSPSMERYNKPAGYLKALGDLEGVELPWPPFNRLIQGI